MVIDRPEAIDGAPPKGARQQRRNFLEYVDASFFSSALLRT